MGVDLGSGANFWDAFTGDDFTGDNDDPANPVAWETTAEVDPTVPWNIQNNKLTHNFINGISGNGSIRSKFSIAGDFDIQLDFTRSATPTTGFGLYWFMTDLAQNNYMRIDIEGGVKYQQKSRINGGSATADGSWGTSDTSGIFKITRQGNVCKTWFWRNNSFWQQTGNTITSAFLAVPFFTLFSNSDNNGANGTWTYDNYVITSGTVVPP